MAVKKKYPNLGRGLDALISTGEVSTSGSSSINEVDIHSIKANPNQPRVEFDEEALEELAESIRQIGIIQPLPSDKWRMAPIKSLPVNAAGAHRNAQVSTPSQPMCAPSTMKV